MAERIRILFCEDGIIVMSIRTAFSVTISTIVLAITGVFGGGGGAGGSPPKDEGALKMVKQASRCAQKACWEGC